MILKNGKIKEFYSNGKLKFEGECLNGKIWNGKGYNINGDEDYEIKNGKGYIKEYWENDKLKFEVNYLNGVSNGKGKEYYFDGALRFKGDYLNGKRNGLGEEYYGNDNIKNQKIF